MNTGSVIRAHREARGWSQRNFIDALSAQGMTVDASRVSRIESGEVDLRFSQVLTICAVLGCTPNDLAGASMDVTTSAAIILDAAIERLTSLKSEILA